MQVFLPIVAFSLQTDGSGRPVLIKGKRPKFQSVCEFMSLAHDKLSLEKYIATKSGEVKNFLKYI